MKISCLNTAGSSFFSDFLLNFVCFASCDETADIMERISTGLESVLNGVQLCIFPGELVVGYNFSDGEKQYTGQDPIPCANMVRKLLCPKKI